MTAMKNGLYQRGRLWWIQFRAGGRTVRESSGSTRKEDAKAMLDAKRTDSRKGELVLGVGKVTLADLFTRLIAETNPAEIARLMVGREVSLSAGKRVQPLTRAVRADAGKGLSIQNLSVTGSRGIRVVDDVRSNRTEPVVDWTARNCPFGDAPRLPWSTFSVGAATGLCSPTSRSTPLST